MRDSGILKHMKPSVAQTRVTASCESRMYLESGGEEHSLSSGLHLQNAQARLEQEALKPQ